MKFILLLLVSQILSSKTTPIFPTLTSDLHKSQLKKSEHRKVGAPLTTYPCCKKNSSRSKSFFKIRSNTCSRINTSKYYTFERKNSAAYLSKALHYDLVELQDFTVCKVYLEVFTRLKKNVRWGPLPFSKAKFSPTYIPKKIAYLNKTREDHNLLSGGKFSKFSLFTWTKDVISENVSFYKLYSAKFKNNVRQK